ncbi:MAG: BMP family ABC transporter substrate-binding protein [Anaerolineales bacterium]
MRGEPGALPLLSHALLETWKRRNGRWLTLRGYAEASGVHGAIARTADFVYNRQLSREQQITARNIFLRLTELSEDLIGTRRRASPTEFTTLAAPPELVEETLNILTAARLVIRSENGVEVAHEALIREWPTLQQWLAEDRLSLRLHHHLAEVSRQWDSLGRDPGELYRGARLAQVVEWAGNHPDLLNPLEQEFLQASRADEERLQIEKDQQQQRELETARQLAASEKKRAEQQLTSNRRLRLFTAVIALVFLVTLAAAWVAVEQRNHANRITYLAHSRELTAAALNYLDLDPQLSILLALEAVEESQFANVPVSPETESVLHQAVRHSRQTHIIHAGQMSVVGVSFSPDGKWVCTSGQDGTLKLWDTKTWSLERTFMGHTAEVWPCLFHTNGRQIASSSRDHTIRGWDLDTGQEIWSYLDEHSIPMLLDHSPDGSQLSLAVWDGRIVVLDAADGSLVHEIVTLPSIVSVSYHPGGSVIGVVDISGIVQLFDTRTYEEKARLETNSESQGFISFSPDGRKMAVASLDGWLDVWDFEKLEKLWSTVGEPGSRYASVIFSPDSAFLVTSSFSRIVQVWDASDGKQVMTLVGHQGVVYSTSFSPSGTQIVTGSSDDTIRIWDFAPAREISVIASPQGTGSPDGSRRAVYSPDGRWLAAGHGDQGSLGIWDANNGEVVRMLAPVSPSGPVTAVIFHPGGQLLAAGDVSGEIWLWDLTNGKVLKQWKGHEGSVVALHFDRAGDCLISTGTDGTIKQWNTVSGDQLRWLGFSLGDSNRFAASPDDRHLLMTTWWGALRLVDIETGQELQKYRGQIGVIEDMAFSNNGQMIASANDDGSSKSIVIVWDASSAEKLFQLEHPLAPAVGLAYSPDDRLLATVSLDATLRLFDLSTGRQILVLDDVSMKRPNGVAFSPDGRMLAVTCEEGISTYYVQLEDVIALAKTRLSRGFTPAECTAFAIGRGCSQEEKQQLAVTTAPTARQRRLACFFPDLGGIQLTMFTQIPYEGMLAAAEYLGWDTLTVEPILVWEVRASLDKINQAGCDLIIVVAFDQATLTVPEDHPEQRYLFFSEEEEIQNWENVWSAVYAEDQASFMAGYLAAAMTRSGKVGIFGGGPFPPVIRFMDGFALGIEHYNRRHLAQVELIGWQAGGGGSQPLFTGFFDPEIGFKTTQSLVSQGADIIFPVAGSVMSMAASEAALTSAGVWMIGVDEDWAANNPRYAPITLTSVIKYLDKPVWWAMQAVGDGSFTGGLHLAHLENGGVGLAPYYELDALIPEQVKAELEQIKGEIIAGKLQTQLSDWP